MTVPGFLVCTIFNNDIVVMGIYHSGRMLLGPKSDLHCRRNAGSSMIAILGDLRDNALTLHSTLRLQ